MTMPTAPMAYSGSGWSSGIAAQVNLPSISTPRLLYRWTPSRAGFRPHPPLPRTRGRVREGGTRDRLVDDALEQVRPDRAIGRRRHRFARLCQLRVTGIVERRPGAAHLRDPGVEIAGGHRFGDKPHVGKA